MSRSPSLDSVVVTDASTREVPVPKSSKPTRPRVWRACEVCRKRKEPCRFCVSNSKECSFTRANDHASLSRLRENDTQARLDSLEAKLDRLIPLIETTHSWFMQATQLSGGRTATVSSTDPLALSLPDHNIAPSSTSLPSTHETALNFSTDPEVDYVIAGGTGDGDDDTSLEEGTSDAGEEETQSHGGVSRNDAVNGDRGAGPPDNPVQKMTWADRLAGQFAQDSSGNMRYLGGATTFVLSQAVESVRQAQPSVHEQSVASVRAPVVDHLYFRPNVLYRPLEGLPAPANIRYPPAIVSEALVQVYFEKIHHNLPIVDKHSFLQKYRETMLGLSQSRPSNDSHFLCVLFAVYASAASLTKTVYEDRAEFQFSSPKEYIGLEFYEQALYMYWTGSRLQTIEHVTCMTLLASCLAGWNTLSQSWVLAGQAVRGAQDLGLHRSPKNSNLPEEAKEYRRRVWWCVFSLDKMLSVSLGRPSGINDDDCDVELPSDAYCCQGAHPSLEQPGDNPMTGIISFLKITIILGKIERTAHSISFLKTYDNSADNPVVRETIGKLDEMMAQWSDTLPDPIKFAANNLDRPSMFALCLLGHFTLYACTLNLHRPFMPDLNNSSRKYTQKSLQRCLSAAQGCIRIGDEVKKLLPTSHNCQFCVQYLTISGVTLLRCLPYVSDTKPLITAATRCRNLLSQLEDTWPGSKRCGSLMQDLLDVCSRNRSAPSNGRPSSTLRDPSSNTAIASSSNEKSSSASLKRSIDQILPELAAPPSKTRNLPTETNADVTSQFGPPIFSIPATDVNMHPPSTQPLPGPANGPQSVPPPADNIVPDLSNEGFDVSQFTDSAPFNLTDEINALLEQMQNSTGSTGEQAWGTTGNPAQQDWSQWATWDLGLQ